jgi:hypothetical protein
MSVRYKIVRTDKEIDDLLNKCVEAEEHGSAYRGMTYEQGIKEAIDWLTEEGWEYPLPES